MRAGRSSCHAIAVDTDLPDLKARRDFFSVVSCVKWRDLGSNRALTVVDVKGLKVQGLTRLGGMAADFCGVLIRLWEARHGTFGTYGRGFHHSEVEAGSPPTERSVWTVRRSFQPPEPLRQNPAPYLSSVPTPTYGRLQKSGQRQEENNSFMRRQMEDI